MILQGDNVVIKSNILERWGVYAGSRGWVEGPGDWGGSLRINFGKATYNVSVSELEVVEKLKKNDVVVVRNKDNEGDIGLVVKTSPDGYTDLVCVEVPHSSKATTEQCTLPIWEVEVIDHINETKEDDDAIDAWLDEEWPEAREQRPGDQSLEMETGYNI